MPNQPNGHIAVPDPKEIAFKEKRVGYNRKYFEKLRQKEGKVDKPV